MVPRSKSCGVMLGVVIASLCAPILGRAASPSQFEALEPLLQEALERHLEVRAAEALVAATSERPSQAGALPDPTFTIGYQNDGAGISLGEQEMTQLAFVWSQAIPFPGKRGLAADVSGRDVERARARLDRVRLGVRADVERAWIRWALANEQLDLVDEESVALAQIEAVSRARYSSGLGSQQDVLRAQIEIIRLDQLRVGERAAQRIALAEINRLRDRGAAEPLAVPAALVAEIPLPEREAFLAQAFEQSPELRDATTIEDQAGLQHAAAEKNLLPDFFVSGGYMNRGGLDPMWQASAGISVPLWASDKQTPAIREAEARGRGARALAESTKLLLRARCEQRLDVLDAIETSLRLDKDGVLPQDQLAAEASIASYQTGQVPFVAVLEAVVNLYRDRATYLARRADLAATRAALDELSLAPVDVSSGGERGAMTPTGGGSGGAAMPVATSLPAAGAPAEVAASAPSGGGSGMGM